MIDSSKAAKEADAAIARKAARIELLTTGKFSDFTISCRRSPVNTIQVFKAHRVVMLRKSEYFDKLIEGNFKECIEQNAMIEEDPDVIASVLWFIYTREYPVLQSRRQKLTDIAFTSKGLFIKNQLSHLELFDVADRFMLPTLQNAARQALITFVKDGPPSEPSERETLHDLLSMIYDTQNSTSTEAKNLVVWVYARHVAMEDLKTLTETFPQFLWDLYEESDFLLKHPHPGCHNCKRPFGKEDSKSIIVREKTDEYEWIICDCGFRGLCSRDCKADNVFFAVKIAYCEICFRQCDEYFSCEVKRGAGVLQYLENIARCYQWENLSYPTLERAKC